MPLASTRLGSWGPAIRQMAELSPRLLRASDAAAYLSLPVTVFQRLRIGVVQLGKSIRYDRLALDAYLDQLGGLSAKSPPQDLDEAEAALARFHARDGHAAGRS